MVTTPPEGHNAKVSALAGAALGDVLQAVAQRLDGAGLCFGHGTDNAWDEAVLLVLSACDLPVDAGDEVLDYRVGEGQAERIVHWLEQRIGQRLPLPYLIGRAWFAGLEFGCDARALIPRSPLAEVIQDGFAPWWTGDEPTRLLDLCCGGGSIGIAAAVYNPRLQVMLADISADALELARENVARHHVGARVECVESDLFDAIEPVCFDIILCNPPYVNREDLASMPAEYTAEPALGLGSGDDGLDATRRILRGAGAFLAPRGILLLELGNSWTALDELLATLPLTWLEFRQGGHGVLLLRAEELPAVAEALEG
ncbi:MAG: 50S ribosomal protein L3 N(5)-glutamine methyltransferase [Halieaceae bacterium]|jgi:ribosomal protein L3 glutamine methyltransferase|nr:50S ribosomal protein L3 N(5)-glutamine methyltransferase [Halieaceae bacterium]